MSQWVLHPVIEADLQLSSNDHLDLLETRLAERSGGGKVSRIHSQAKIGQQLMETFELVGGISRLARWANDPENYSEFVKIWAKLAPKDGMSELSQGFTYQSMVPSSPLSKAGGVVSPIRDAVLIEQDPEDSECPQ